MRYNIKTSGMGCPHCIKRVTKAMTELNTGIIKVELNDIIVDYDGDKENIRKAIEELGFKVISIEAV